MSINNPSHSLQQQSLFTSDFSNTSLSTPFIPTTLIPRLPPTYSLPSLSAPPHAPYGIIPTADILSSRKDFLQRARHLLQESALSTKNLTSPTRPTRHSFLVADIYDIRFTWTGLASRSVFLAGSFNAWRAPIAMTSIQKNEKSECSTWECVLRLSVGEYRYKYVVDGEWVVDQSRLCDFEEGKPIANKLIVERIVRE